MLFGGSQLPKLAKNLGKAQKEFKDGLAEGQKARGRAEGAPRSKADADRVQPSDSDRSPAPDAFERRRRSPGSGEGVSQR